MKENGKAKKGKEGWERRENVSVVCVHMRMCTGMGQPPKQEEKERKNMSLTCAVWAHAVGSAGDRGWHAGNQMCHCHDSWSRTRVGSVFLASGNHFISHDMNTHLICSLDLFVCVCVCVCVVQLCMKNTAYCSLKHDNLYFGFLCNGGKCWERDKEVNNKIWKKQKKGQDVTV